MEILPSSADSQHTEVQDNASEADQDGKATCTTNQDSRFSSAIEEDALRQIASHISQRTDQGDPTSPYDLSSRRMCIDPDVLDPASPSFDARTWAGEMMRGLDTADRRLLHTGVLLKDITVCAPRSSDEDQQHVTVTSVLLLITRAFFSRSRAPQKRIIRNVDVLLKSGEMLLILGRPGSGCSTLLRTISGELKGGMQLENPSAIHYNGIPQLRMLQDFKGEVRSSRDFQFSNTDASIPDYVQSRIGHTHSSPHRRTDAHIRRIPAYP